MLKRSSQANMRPSVLGPAPAAERGAQFVCALALVRHADDPLPILCEGLWHGSILYEARGEHGFGYERQNRSQGPYILANSDSRGAVYFTAR